MSSHYELLPAAQGAAWNEFAAAHPHGDVLQCWEWGELKSRTGWQANVLAARRGTEIVAGALVLRRHGPLGLGIAYCPRGPLLAAYDAAAWREFVQAVRQLSPAPRPVLLKVDPALPEGPAARAALAEAGLRSAAGAYGAFGGTQPRHVMKVDIALDEEALLGSFHHKTRYNIRLAARKGVVVRQATDRGDIATFYALLEETARRDGFRVRAQSYFEGLWDLVLARGLGALFLATVQGEPLAGAISFRLGRQGWYVYGASAGHRRQLMPSHLVQWEMMRWAQAHGCAVYDMRGVAPADAPEDDPLRGLNRFKAGFGAQHTEYVGEWDASLRRPLAALLTAGLQVARRLRTAGRPRRETAPHAAPSAER